MRLKKNSNCPQHAEQIEDITFGEHGHLFTSSHPWRDTMHAAVTPDMVARHQAPHMAPLFMNTVQGLVRDSEQSGGPVLWYEAMWSAAFESVARAALGPELLSKLDMAALKTDFKTSTRGSFKPVRTAHCPGTTC